MRNRAAARRSRPTGRRTLRFFATAALSAGAVWLILAYAAQIFRIQGASMNPVLRSGERVLVNKIGVRFSALRRGDVVVFRDPGESGTILVKRVVGVPGDTVRFLGDEVRIAREPRASGAPGCGMAANAAPPPDEPGAASVPVGDGHYFVVGDNLRQSSDSRHWGLLPRDAIIGKAALRVFPWDRIGFVRR